MRLTPALYLASYAASILGNSIAAIALPLILLQTTGSIAAAGTLAAVTSIPAFLVGLAAGVVIDRINRRTSSIVSDLISAAAIAALPVVDAITGLNLGWFILFGLLGTLGDVPGLTARETMLPAIVRHSGVSAERLVGMRESIAALMVVIGPAIAGTLMSLLEGTTVLWVTAGTSLLAALLTLLIPHRVGTIAPAPSTGRGVARAARELAEGWRVLLRSSALLRASTVLSLAMIAVLTSMQALVLPAHFEAVDEPGMLGFMLSALAAGTLIGAGLYAGLGTRIRRRTWFAVGVVGSAIALVGLALLPGTPLLLAAAVCFGITSGALGSLTGVLTIEIIPEAVRGRVMGSQNSLLMLAAPLGIVAVAALATWWDLRAAALTLAVVWALAGLVALAAPAFRSLETAADPQEEEVVNVDAQR